MTETLRSTWSGTIVTVVASVLSVLAAMVPSAAAATAPRSVRARTVDERRSDESRPIDTARFEPGQCEEYAPTSGDRHLTVFLDAGHGGLDPGGVGQTEDGQTVEEADITLPVELDTMALLRHKGFTVVVSRTKDDTVIRPGPGDVSEGEFTAQGVHDDVAGRDVCADMAHANLLLGIYMDAGGSPYNAGGVTGYDTDRPFTKDNLRFATLVQNDLMSTMNGRGWGIPNLGVVDDSQLGGPALTEQAADYGHLLLLGPAEPGWFSTPSTMPGALTEPLFVTDPFEASILASRGGQEVIAGALATAVEQYFPVSSASARSRPSAARQRSRPPLATSRT